MAGFKTKVTPEIENLTEVCKEHTSLDLSLYAKYDVKRGLRDINGKGVLAGLTQVSNVKATKIVDGKEVPCAGSLSYRGYDIKDLTRGFIEDDRYGFEEVTYLLLFGSLPDKKQLADFTQLLANQRSLPTNFVRDVIMKAPSKDIMNGLSRSVLTLYSYDTNPDDTSLPNVLRQCLNLISVFPLLSVYGYQAYNHYIKDKSLYIHNPKKELTTAENILRMLRPDKKYSHLEAKILDIALIPGITLFKMGEPEVPTVHEFLKKNLTQGRCLGFDGRTVSAKEAAELEKMLDENGVSLSVDHDLAGDIWENRPVLSCEPVTELDIKWAGESRADKCARIRKAMEKKGADLFVLTSLDDIAWLLNIRGGDIHCCPVVLSYLVMTKTEIRLFANEKAFQTDVLEALEKDGVTLFPYDSIYEYVKTFKKDKKVLLCKKKVNSRLVSNIPADTRILDEENLTLLPKATKNPVEVENERIAHIRDGVAVTKFIYWLKKNVGRIPITELSAAEKLYEFRSEQEDFIDNSFDPIIAYGKHAAIVHYFATPETDIPLEPSGFLLADTGGHFKEGTTDITCCHGADY